MSHALATSTAPTERSCATRPPSAPSLAPPRRVVLLVPAGKPVDMALARLVRSLSLSPRSRERECLRAG